MEIHSFSFVAETQEGLWTVFLYHPVGDFTAQHLFWQISFKGPFPAMPFGGISAHVTVTIAKPHCVILLLWSKLHPSIPPKSPIPGAVSGYNLWLWDSPAVEILLVWNWGWARADWLRPLEGTPGRCLGGPGATSWSSEGTLGAQSTLISPVTLWCLMALLSVLFHFVLFYYYFF